MHLKSPDGTLLNFSQLALVTFTTLHGQVYSKVCQVHESLLQLVVALQVSSSFKSALLGNGADCRCTW